MAIALAIAGLNQMVSATGEPVSLAGRPIVVAVVDSGGDPWDLEAQGVLWSNQAERFDGSDSDGNGLVDDIYGWDFAGQDRDPFDWTSVSASGPTVAGDAYSHGTAMTSLIVDRGGDVKAGLRIMLLRVTDSRGPIDPEAVVKAIRYATEQHADLINLSLGGGWPPESALYEMIEASEKAVFVVAAGNSGEEIMTTSPQGRMCQLDHVICVASLGSSNFPVGTRATNSNFGPQTIDLAAFGGPVMTTGRRTTSYPLSAVTEGSADQNGTGNHRLWPAIGLSCSVISGSWVTTHEERSSLEVRTGDLLPSRVIEDSHAIALCPDPDGDQASQDLEGTSVATALVTGALIEWESDHFGMGRDESVRLFLASLEIDHALSLYVVDGRSLVDPDPAIHKPRASRLLVGAIGLAIVLVLGMLTKRRQIHSGRRPPAIRAGESLPSKVSKGPL